MLISRFKKDTGHWFFGTEQIVQPLPSPQKKADSFTLVEMLVAISILSFIMITLLSMTSSLMAMWRGGQAHNERRANTQAIFDFMTRDLQQAALPSGRTAMPTLFNTNSLQMVINPTGVTGTYELPQAIFWQAPVATDGGSNGNLAIVGYFVQWVQGAPYLCRVLINPSSTTYYQIYSAPSNWMTDNALANAAPATAASSYSGLLSGNVLGLWVQALDGAGNPIVQPGNTTPGEAFDSRTGYAYNNYLYTNSASATVATTNAPGSLPAAVQVAIVIVDSATARHLTGSEKPSPTSLTGNFWGDVRTFYGSLPPIIQKGAEIQTTTIPIANGPR